METIEIAHEHSSIGEGISAIELPCDLSDEEFRYWYEPAIAPDAEGVNQIVRPARITIEAERQRLLRIAKEHNTR